MVALRTAVKTGTTYVGVKPDKHSRMIDVIPITDLNKEIVIFKAFPDMTIVMRGQNNGITNIQGFKR